MEQENTGMTVANQGYNAQTVMDRRLDPTRYLADIEAFLRGTRVVGYKEGEGMIEPVFGTSGEALMNDKGIQNLMSWMTMLFSPQTVQGNKKKDEYEDYMVRLHEDLAKHVMDKLHAWDIEEDDYESIVDRILAVADLYFSRTIDNLERQSYSDTVRHIERYGETKGGGIVEGIKRLSPFGG